MPTMILKPGREKSLLRRHPWVFSGAVFSVQDEPVSGGTIDLRSHDGRFLGRAAYSPQSQIRARVWTFEDEQIDADFLRKRIRTSIQTRAILNLASNTQVLTPDTSACRLVHAESDGLPGLIVDRYGDTLVMQCLSSGAEFWRETLADILLKETSLRHIYERSDADVRELEGLLPRSGALRGNPVGIMNITENGLRYLIDLAKGHKTGFYLDQRANRQRLRELARGREVLDCFCYSGGFTLNALAGGAKSVVSVDSSSEALSLCSENMLLNTGAKNGLPDFINHHAMLERDVFQELRKFRDERREFDLIVLDPPKFAPTSAQVERAARGYKDINLLAFKLLRPGGLLFTFSCSGGVDAALFQKIIASAALDAGVEAQILEHLTQSPDHPTALSFPEGAYLKGLICLRI